jgi:hypothetical protein
VFLDDLVDRPVFHLEQILSFAGPALPDRALLRSLAEELQTHLRAELSFDNVSSLLSAASSSTVARPEVISALRQVTNSLREEIVGTKGLSAWPCRSFRSLDPPAIVSAGLVVANCSSAWVTCSVDFDRQEAASGI